MRVLTRTSDTKEIQRMFHTGGEPADPARPGFLVMALAPWRYPPSRAILHGKMKRADRIRISPWPTAGTKPSD
jgi:hypothetical protein